MNISFLKVSGAGNDFVLIDNREQHLHIEWAEFAEVHCRRRLGIGADGLLVIEPSERSDFMLQYFNADGSSGSLCGNGARCAAMYMMDSKKLDHVSFQALDHIYHAQRSEHNVRLEMKDPHSLQLEIPLHYSGHDFVGHYVNTGSPHVVIYQDNLPALLVRELNDIGITPIGKAIRFDAKFAPEGTNVNFVSIPSHDIISMRTYERGVEDETLACGTGAVACSVISGIVHNIPSPVTVRTRGGETLKVHFTREGSNLRDVALEGGAKIVFRGEIQW